MELFYAYRKSFSMACFITAILYAFAVGAEQPVLVRIVDGGFYGSILFSIVLVLWNFLRFAIPVSITPKFRLIFISVFVIITSLLITGVETFAFYLCFPSSFTAFVPTLPARIFITFLLFIIACLFYLYFYESIEDNRKISEGEEPMDTSQAGDMGNVETDSSITSSQTTPTSTIDRITVRSGTKIKIIPIENILYIQADGDYISIRTAEGKWLKEQTMNYTEARLPIDSFVRIHRSYIVNIHQISRIERYGEKQLIVLHNNEKIKISAARYQLLRQILGI